MPKVKVTATAMTGGISIYATNKYDGTDAKLPNSLNRDVCLKKLTHSGTLILDPSNMAASCTDNTVGDCCGGDGWLM